MKALAILFIINKLTHYEDNKNTKKTTKHIKFICKTLAVPRGSTQKKERKKELTTTHKINDYKKYNVGYVSARLG